MTLIPVRLVFPPLTSFWTELHRLTGSTAFPLSSPLPPSDFCSSRSGVTYALSNAVAFVICLS